MRRIEGQSPDSSTSAFQRHIDDIIHGIKSEDATCGDGGQEMLNALRGAFRCVHPDKGGFQSIKDYLRFRRLNVGAASVFKGGFCVRSTDMIA